VGASRVTERGHSKTVEIENELRVLLKKDASPLKQKAKELRERHARCLFISLIFHV
jgi:hypothetical protein